MLVMELRQNISLFNFDSVLVDIGARDARGSKVHLRPAQDALSFDCIEKFLDLTKQIYDMVNDERMKDIAHFEKMCTKYERVLQFGHS